MSDSQRQRFDLTVAKAREEDGNPPFSDGALVEYAQGTRELIWLSNAAALATETTAEFVVDPDHRRTGQGGAMLSLLQASRDSLLAWAHGDHPGAQALAASHGFERARTLLHMSAAVTEYGGELPGVSAFRAEDADEWLALNARTFAKHPEQGSITRADLETSMAQPWFREEDFLLLREHQRIVAYAWMKVEGSLGEFYVVGVDPERRGAGLGRRMVDAGFAHLAARGIRSAHLYVEGDNVAGLRLYHSMGFAERSVDVQYRWTAS
jgi:mycothiol synthase